MLDRNSPSINDTHVRVGSKSLGAWVPKDWESEAHALLFAARRLPDPFGRMPSFNTGLLNPLFGMPRAALRELAATLDVKAPWFRVDCGVESALTGISYSANETGSIPTIVIKCVDPMVHVALVALLASSEGWKFNVAIHNESFEGVVTSRSGRHMFAFVSSIDDDDSRLILNYMSNSKALPAGLLMLPIDHSFYSEIAAGQSIKEGIQLLDKTLAYGFANNSHVAKKVSGKQTSLQTVSRQAAAELATH